jgi:hypothetical protein
METAAILALINAGLSLIEHLPGIIAALKQTHELTPEQEAALDARIAGLKDQAQWKVS